MKQRFHRPAVVALAAVAFAALGLPGSALAALPRNVTLPQLHGIWKVGSLVRSNTGSWAGTTPMTVSVRWRRCNVFGAACGPAFAAGSQIQLAQSEKSHTVRAVAKAVNGDGSAFAWSRPSLVVTGDGTWAGLFPAFTKGSLTPGLHIRKTLRGYCWTGSLVDGRSNAWRCFTGNFIRDPCFSNAAEDMVVCPRTARFRRLIRLNLTEPLPDKYANSGQLGFLPWTIVTRAGRACIFVSGASLILRHKRLNYVCNSHTYLWGLPNHHDAWWRIAQSRTTSPKHFDRATVREAWW